MRQYLKPLREWAAFCRREKCSVLKPKAHYIIQFLTKKFKEGVKAGTLNTYKSALSFVMGERISKDPWIARLQKGFANLRPARPKYDHIYDLDPVLRFIENLYPLEELSLLELTYRLVLLLAVVTAHRKQTLSLIKIENISKTRSGFEIEIPDRIKTSRVGVHQPLLILPRFEDKPKLCVARTLEHYLEETKELRGEIRSLFITTTKPYKPASKDTISRWLKTCLNKAGIDEKFAPHSIRHASTSTAFRRGVNVSIIKNLAGWSEKSRVFDMFYNRPFVAQKSVFAETILLEK